MGWTALTSLGRYAVVTDSAVSQQLWAGSGIYTAGTQLFSDHPDQQDGGQDPTERPTIESRRDSDEGRLEGGCATSQRLLVFAFLSDYCFAGHHESGAESFGEFSAVITEEPGPTT